MGGQGRGQGRAGGTLVEEFSFPKRGRFVAWILGSNLAHCKPARMTPADHKCGNFYTPPPGNDDELISFLKMFGGDDNINVVGREGPHEVGVCHFEQARICEYCFPVVLRLRKCTKKKKKTGGATVMRVSAAGNKPWKPAAMKTIPKLCSTAFFSPISFSLSLSISISSDRSSVTVRPLGQLSVQARRQLTGVFVLREISVKKHGGRL